MDELTTATGKVFSSDYLVTIPKPAMLFVRIIGEDGQTLETVFGNPEETALLNYAGRDYEGYTTLDSITDEGDAMKVVLKK